jgi:hypothetical protein
MTWPSTRIRRLLDTRDECTIRSRRLQASVALVSLARLYGETASDEGTTGNLGVGLALGNAAKSLHMLVADWLPLGVSPELNADCPSCGLVQAAIEMGEARREGDLLREITETRLLRLAWVVAKREGV